MRDYENNPRITNQTTENLFHNNLLCFLSFPLSRILSNVFFRHEENYKVN